MSIFTNRGKETELRRQHESLHQQWEAEVLAFSLAVAACDPDNEQLHRLVLYSAQTLVLPHPENYFNSPAWRGLVAKVERERERDAKAKLVEELLNRAAGLRNASPSDVSAV